MRPKGDQEAPVENQTWGTGVREGFTSDGLINLPATTERWRIQSTEKILSGRGLTLYSMCKNVHFVLQGKGKLKK